MKNCSYCGKEYPDDATVCALDGGFLIGGSACEQKNAPTEEVDLIWPAYRWSALDAWKCVAMLTMLEIIFEALVFGFGRSTSSLYQWTHSGLGSPTVRLFYYAIQLLAIAYFARTDTFTDFCRAFGFHKGPTSNVWWGVAIALAIRFFGHFALSHGWGKGVNNRDLYGFKHEVGFQRILFLISPLFLAPVCEECIYRGFLYKAFRGSYAMGMCVALVILWTVFNHQSSYHHWIAAFDLTGLAVVLCFLRERSASLWDCIICHLAFNASILLFSVSQW